MFVHRNDRKPTRHGAYHCFGTINRLTPHEKRTKFVAFWDGECFVDKDGEDLTEINNSVEWWFDIDMVDNPE